MSNTGKGGLLKSDEEVANELKAKSRSRKTDKASDKAPKDKWTDAQDLVLVRELYKTKMNNLSGWRAPKEMKKEAKFGTAVIQLKLHNEEEDGEEGFDWQPTAEQCRQRFSYILTKKWPNVVPHFREVPSTAAGLKATMNESGAQMEQQDLAEQLAEQQDPEGNLEEGEELWTLWVEAPDASDEKDPIKRAKKQVKRIIDVDDAERILPCVKTFYECFGDDPAVIASLPFARDASAVGTGHLGKKGKKRIAAGDEDEDPEGNEPDAGAADADAIKAIKKEEGRAISKQAQAAKMLGGTIERAIEKAVSGVAGGTKENADDVEMRKLELQIKLRNSTSAEAQTRIAAQEARNTHLAQREQMLRSTYMEAVKMGHIGFKEAMVMINQDVEMLYAAEDPLAPLLPVPDPNPRPASAASNGAAMAQQMHTGMGVMHNVHPNTLHTATTMTPQQLLMLSQLGSQLQSPLSKLLG